MGDQGRLYVNDDVVPAYKDIIQHADLILPNQFEAECVTHHLQKCNLQRLI
jgi:pyridoxine kinase